MTNKEKVIVVLLAALNFTHILDFMIMMPLGNHLMPFFKISTQEFSFLVASYTISAFVSSFLAAFFVDNFDRKRVLLFGYIGFLLATLACGIAPSFWFLLIMRVIAGLFGGIIGAQVIAIISDLFTYERRGAAMGAVMSSFALASTFGVPAALYLANAISWHAPFIAVAIMGFVLLPMLMRFVPKMNKHLADFDANRSKLELIGAIAKNAGNIQALMFSGLIMFAHFIIIPFINPYMEFNLGYKKELTPLIYLSGGLAAFVAAIFLGKLSDKMGKLKIFTICLLISLPLMLIITNLIRIPYGIVLVFFAMWFFVATGRGITAQAMVSNIVQPEYRGAFQSLNSSMQQLGSGLAALVAGQVVSSNAQHQIIGYPWLGMIGVFVMLFTLWLGRKLFSKVDA